MRRQTGPLGALIIASAIALMLSGVGSASQVAKRPSNDQYQSHKVRICHHVHSKRGRYVTITVRRASLPAHLRHGDTIGPCVFASVSRSGRVALRSGSGHSVTRLAADRRYSIVVLDRSRSANFRLQGPGVNRHSGIRFVGTVRWKITFQRGEYSYLSDSRPSVHHVVRAR